MRVRVAFAGGRDGVATAVSEENGTVATVSLTTVEFVPDGESTARS